MATFGDLIKNAQDLPGGAARAEQVPANPGTYIATIVYAGATTSKSGVPTINYKAVIDCGPEAGQISWGRQGLDFSSDASVKWFRVMLKGFQFDETTLANLADATQVVEAVATGIVGSRVQIKVTQTNPEFKASIGFVNPLPADAPAITASVSVAAPKAAPVASSGTAPAGVRRPQL